MYIMGSFKREDIMGKKIITFVFSLSVVLGCSSAGAFEIASQEIEISAGDKFVSSYIWRGQDLYGDNDPAHQPYVDITLAEYCLGADLGLSLWSSFPLSRGHENAEEFDYTVSLSNNFWEVWDASFGYTYFDFPNSGSTADVSEPWVSLTLNNIVPDLPAEIAAHVFAGYDLQAASGGPDEGWYYSWGFSTELDLPSSMFMQEGQSLSLGVTNWGNDGVAGLEPSGLYATDLSLATSFNLGKLNISPGLNFMLNHESKINNGDDEFWAGIEFAWAF